ncbi:Succinate-semialdehyde dehydrogenase [NADP(+)] GabD [Vibrio aerogenes CECT 7868]|uniref:Succinate-semialdehyde dehydrogenase [NADP(+)] GabD n=1 Tax=Vibrio aerogenes CECT 7868 TaxID=1216006 RepID=A0A1M6BVT9_9VIBR|nr:NAD-dependent succinate-semialdehyde dehydrogenase [Vibrio aerogenes]SHI52869.1 Succinate-semialdehyde dehydrogenase [NADP(+)] GabD [Vibrio aerogenes CECT 7868]
MDSILETLQDKSLLKCHGYINGEWVASSTGRQFDVINPSTERVIAQVSDLGPEETEQAVFAADAALESWRDVPAKQKAAILRRWYELVTEHQDDLALMMTAEQGKILAESKGEILYGASYIEWFAEEAKRIYGDVLPATGTDRRSIVIKQPVGVVGAITPWNFPNAMITRKVAPALAAGCTVVLKPAAETPLSALALGELATRAGIPPGVFNIIPGTDAPAIGNVLTSSKIVKKISFTGSTAVGKILMAQSAKTVKKTSMELGGNAPVVIFKDADLDKAIEGALAAKFRNAGQTCICANRILVEDEIYDEFVARFSEQVARFTVGDGFDSQTAIGPLITSKAVDNVDTLVKDAIAKGAEVCVGGAAESLGSHFYRPTVLKHLDATMRLAKEEVFGPVAPVFRFTSEAEAVAMANDTDAGLAAYLYTKDAGRIWRVSEKLAYGMVGVNETAISSEMIPFGGVKQSGQGREGSRYGLEDYLEIKYLCMGDLS